MRPFICILFVLNALLIGPANAKFTSQILPIKFLGTEQQQLISIKAVADAADIESVSVELLSANNGILKTEVRFRVGTKSDFEVELPGSSKVIRSKGIRVAPRSSMLNLDIALISGCFLIRLGASVFGGLSCPSVGHLPLAEIDQIKVEGEVALIGSPIVQQINSGAFGPNEENANFSSGVENFVSDECSGENMVYSLKMNDSWTIRGRKFNCSFAWLLDRYELSDKNAISEQIEVKGPGHAKFVFLTAADEKYFPSLRKIMANIKELFGCQQKIIAYDLGKVSSNKEWMSELNSVCRLEWRIFNFSQMTGDRVRHLNSYAWKIFLIAEILLEYDTVFWLDTSIVLTHNNWTSLLAPIQTRKIGLLQQPSSPSHGMNSATHPGMFEYLPMYTNFEYGNGTDPAQFEAGFLVLQKSEPTRQLMKWALLCAAEADCIVPMGQTKDCHFESVGPRRIFTPKEGPNWTCHRQDQSLFNILRYNMEYQHQIQDPSFLPHTNLAHPRWSEIDGHFFINRSQVFNGTGDEWLQRVKCC